MAVITVDVGKTPTQLADLLSLTQQGTEVIIAKGGQPLAKLMPIPKLRIGSLNPGSITITEDFDAPLPDEFWAGTE